MAGGCVEPVRQQEGHQGQPEDDVEHDGRTDALGAEGEPGVRPGDPGLGQQPISEGRPRGRSSRGDVAEGQGRHVDPEQPEPPRTTSRQYRVGELGIRDQGADLEQDAEGQVGTVDVGQGIDLGPVARQQGDGDIENEQEGEKGAYGPTNLAVDEGAPVPPSPAGRRRPVLGFGRHHAHVVTTRRLNLTC